MTAQKILWPAVLCGALGCSTAQQEPGESGTRGIEVRGLRILNRSFSVVTEVRLLVSETLEFVSCGNIPIHGECATTFPLRQYQGNRIEIRWKQGGADWSTGEFVVEHSQGIDPGRPAMVRVTITTAGLAATELVQ
jgi:hypothetical protein